MHALSPLLARYGSQDPGIHKGGTAGSAAGGLATALQGKQAVGRGRNVQNQLTRQVHDIKGANAKSDALIDILVDFFNSPAYLTSPKAGTSRVRTGPKSTGDRTGHAVLARPPRPKLPPASAVAHSSLKRRVDAPSSVRGPTTQSQSVAQPPVDTRLNDAAGTSANVATAPKDLSSGEQRPSAHTGAPSAPPTAPTVEAQTVAATTAQASGANEAGVESAVRSDLALLQRSVAALEHQQSDQVFETRVKGILNTTLQQHIVLIEEREAALQRREKALDEAWSRLERAMASQ